MGGGGGSCCPDIPFPDDHLSTSELHLARFPRSTDHSVLVRNGRFGRGGFGGGIHKYDIFCIDLADNGRRRGLRYKCSGSCIQHLQIGHPISQEHKTRLPFSAPCFAAWEFYPLLPSKTAIPRQGLQENAAGKTKGSLAWCRFTETTAERTG